MVTVDDVGQLVTIQADGEFYRFVDGWHGILDRFDSGLGAVRVKDDNVDAGFKEFLVPPEQLIRGKP